MKPSKDLDEQIDEIRQHCDSLGVPSLWYDKLIKLIEQREREAVIEALEALDADYQTTSQDLELEKPGYTQSCIPCDPLWEKLKELKSL